MSATSDRKSDPRSRRGFALPLAILALALITAAVAASSSATRAEIVANQAVRAQDKAYQMAEAGLQLWLARRTDVGFCSNCVTDPGTASIDSEWTRVSLVGGYADVAAIRVRPKLNDSTPGLFFVKSRGVDTTALMSGTGISVYAERTVGQYATFRTASIRPVAAWVSLTGLTRNSSTSTITGADECGKVPAVSALSLPTGATEYTLGGSATVLTDPTPIARPTAAALMASLGIDWNAIINLNAIPADYTIPTNSWPGSGVWKVTRVKTNPYTIPSDGNGILIVEGDLTVNGNRDFDGIILVGGKITAGGSQPSSGLAISGLNYLLPGAASPPASSLDNSTITSTKSFRYNSCNVATAMALLNTYYVWSNTWLDNVAVW